MMEYALYSYGGGAVLHQVFNALALMFKSQNTYFTPVLSLSAVIGAVWGTLRALFQQNLGLLGKSWFLPTFLIVNILLVPKVSVHIIDPLDVSHHYAKVDGIPFGLAAVTSTISTLSKHLTEALETTLGLEDHARYSKVGPAFAAKLMTLSRDLRVKDPLIQENLKDFVRQCFYYPYVLTNIEPGRTAALNAQNILSFIRENPHPSLGTYWRGEKGQTQFRTCAQCAVDILEVMELEQPRGLQTLAAQLIGGSETPEAQQGANRLKAYFPTAWQSIAHHTTTATEMVGQQMMINAYRESLDDKREEFNLNRIHPELISHSATRSQAQQSTSFLILGKNAGEFMPTLQAVFLSFLCLSFVLVAPLSILPGGMTYLTSWLKATVCVCTWPLFSSLLNAISQYFAVQAGARLLASNGEGLSLLTQSGLAEAGYHAWCYTEGLQASIPLISWALLWGGGYAMTNVFSSFGQGAGSTASKLGSDISDGNVNFDTQNFHNRTIASQQLGQQQLGQSFNLGQRLDNGKFSLLQSTGGEMTLQEAQTTLKTNLASQDTLGLNASESSQRALQASYTASDQKMNSLSDAAQWMTSLGDSFSKAQSNSQGFGSTNTSSHAQDASKSLDQLTQLGSQFGFDKHKAAELGLHAGLDTNKSIFGKALGLVTGFSAGTKGSQNWGARENEFINEVKNSGLGSRVAESWNQVAQDLKEDRSSNIDQFSKQAATQFQGWVKSHKGTYLPIGVYVSGLIF